MALARRGEDNNAYGWLNFVTAATTVGEAIRRINDAWEAGQIARQNYNQIIETLENVHNNAQELYGNLRQQIRDQYYEGMRQIEGPYRREINRVHNQQDNNMQVATNAPREAPMEQFRRRNPATMAPNPTPTPAVAQECK